MGRCDLLIINRSFWPVYPVIGEGLMRLAEDLAPFKKVAVVMQDHMDIRKHLKKSQRGGGVKFYPAWAGSDSSSSVFVRILDMFFFSVWVFLCLLWCRPKKIYVSTDPPLLVPFIVAIFSKLSRASYYYHLQDIHPEATDVVKPIKPVILLDLLKKMDSFTMRRASLLFTLTQEMRREIVNRSGTKLNKLKVSLVDNPSVLFDTSIVSPVKNRGFVFAGNLGRLQRIPLLLKAIERYIEEGGCLEFSFAGGGVYSHLVRELSRRNSLVRYHGVVAAQESARLMSQYEWALLPIEDQVTRYAFPSKTSSYAYAGAKILAICSEYTSVSNWVKRNNLGLTVEPTVTALVNMFFQIERGLITNLSCSKSYSELKRRLSFDVFVQKIKSGIFPE